MVRLSASHGLTSNISNHPQAQWPKLCTCTDSDSPPSLCNAMAKLLSSRSPLSRFRPHTTNHSPISYTSAFNPRESKPVGAKSLYVFMILTPKRIPHSPPRLGERDQQLPMPCRIEIHLLDIAIMQVERFG